MTEITHRNDEAMAYTARIVGGYLAGNQVELSDLPDVLEKVHAAVLRLHGVSAGTGRPQPAVPIEQSITPDFIICLEDGKKYKMLKKHLKTKYDMTPEEYRARWGLPADYPMVAPNYAAKRQQLARASGLGKSR